MHVQHRVSMVLKRERELIVAGAALEEEQAPCFADGGRECACVGVRVHTARVCARACVCSCVAVLLHCAAVLCCAPGALLRCAVLRCAAPMCCVAALCCAPLSC